MQSAAGCGHCRLVVALRSWKAERMCLLASLCLWAFFGKKMNAFAERGVSRGAAAANIA